MSLQWLASDERQVCADELGPLEVDFALIKLLFSQESGFRPTAQ